MALLNRPSNGGALNGVLTTLVTGRGAELTPAGAPIALLPIGGQSEPQLGVVKAVIAATTPIGMRGRYHPARIRAVPD